MGIYGSYAHRLIEAQDNLFNLEKFLSDDRTNFSNILEEITIIKSESISLNENKVIDFIKEKWDKFVQWVKDLWSKICWYVKKIKRIILTKRYDHLMKKIQKMADGMDPLIIFETFEGFRKDPNDGFQEDDLDNYDYDNQNESAIFLEADEGAVRGKIFCRYYGWKSDYSTKKDISIRGIKAVLKDNKIDLDKIISDIKSFASGNSNSSITDLGNINKTFKSIEFTYIADTDNRKKNTILYYFDHGKLHIVEDVKRIVPEIVDKNDQIIEDLEYINSYQPKVMSLINSLNSKVSNMRSSNSPDEDFINNLKMIIQRLTYLNQALLRFTSELNKGFNYYNSIFDKIDSLIAKLDHASDSNLKYQKKDNKPII